MKIKSVQKVMGGVLGAAMLLGFTACSDDHYDIKTGGAASANNTIWQNISATPQLDSLAMILNRVRVYTKEEDQKRTMTYAELLNTPQSFTFWAPLNGTYNAKHYLDQIDEVARLRSEGKTDAADLLEYNVSLQFAQNHLARTNFESQQGEQDVRLFNGKLVTYNVASGLFNGVKLDANTPNIPSSNGVLHILDGISPFAYNIYDYMGANSSNGAPETECMDSVYGKLTNPSINKRYFDEGSSTPGAIVNGNMVYIDSVFSYTNEYLNQSNAQPKNEDSIYIAVIPTDAAWKAATPKLKELYQYSRNYKYGYKGGNRPTDAFPTKISYTEKEVDSLCKYNAQKALITSMYFSPSIFPPRFQKEDGKIDRNKMDEIIQYALTADSLISTNGKVFYNPNKGGRNPLFGNVEPVKASNGVIFPVSTFDLDPSYSFVDNKTFDITYGGSIGDAFSGGVSNTGKTLYLSDENINPELKGEVEKLENKAYRCFESDRNSPLEVYIPLTGVFSTKYKISIQVLPNRINNEKKLRDPKAEDDVEVMPQTQFFAQVYDDAGKRIGNNSDFVDVSDTEIKTYTLTFGKDKTTKKEIDYVDFAKCYNSLPSTIQKCYPLLKISLTKKGVTYRNYEQALSITKIYVTPVHE